MAKPTTYNSLSEAIAAAHYVEQLLGAEHQWINNRLSWLFISQSFCISAYVILSTSTGVRFEGGNTITILKVGLPVLGIICCVFVGVAVLAATRVARSFANERGRLARYINENSPITIPLVGVEGDLREEKWTYWCGELPHRVLPWALGVFWLVLLI
jgi:hypothetical protein